MEVIKFGSIKNKNKYIRFKCDCDTIFYCIIGEGDIEYGGSQYNETYYKSRCPLCNCEVYSSEKVTK